MTKVAHKYKESGCKKICETKLVSTIGKENAFELLILGVDVDESEKLYNSNIY